MSSVNLEVEMAPAPMSMLSPRARDSDPLLPTGNSVSEIESVDEDDDAESGSLPFCRICFESGTENRNELISPCMCKGTQQFVHRSCLDHWRSVKEGFAFSHCTTCRAQFHLRVVELQNSWRKIKFRLFVARDVFLVFLAVQIVIAGIGFFAFCLDEDGKFRNSFDDSWDQVLSMHPVLFYYCTGVVAFLGLVGFGGMMMHCFAWANNPRVAGCQNCCFGWGLLDCFPASWEVWIIIIIVSIVVFVILGIAYGFLAMTLAVQRIWQRHYHIMTKKVLTQEYVVEDLGSSPYTAPALDPKHEDRLRALNLM